MKPSLGNQEIELLKYISDHSEPIPVRDILEQFGEPRGLARTTVLTMLDRLLKKRIYPPGDGGRDLSLELENIEE